MNNQLLRFTTAEAVVNYFNKEIESGRFKPGDKLPSERMLQEQFGISRFSLREGLARLSALGIIRIIHGKGAFISSEINNASLSHVLMPMFSNPTSGSLNDLFEARTLIEERVTALAAQRRSDEDIATLRDILKQSENALDDPSAFGDLDYRFHLQIRQSAGNVFFEKMIDVINDHVKSFLLYRAADNLGRKNALKTHWLILECIEKQDSEKVVIIVQKHMNTGVKNYIEQILNQQ